MKNIDDVDWNTIEVGSYLNWVPGDLKDLDDVDRDTFSQALEMDSLLQEQFKLREVLREDTPALIKIFLARLSPAEPPITLGCILIATRDADRPGDIAMWAWTLVQLAKRKGGLVTAKDLIEAFAGKLPSKEFKSKIWDSQKKWAHGIQYRSPSSDNLLDEIPLWKANKQAGWSWSINYDHKKMMEERAALFDKLLNEFIIPATENDKLGTNPVTKVALVTEVLAMVAAALIRSTHSALKAFRKDLDKNYLPTIFKQQFDACIEAGEEEEKG